MRFIKNIIIAIQSFFINSSRILVSVPATVGISALPIRTKIAPIWRKIIRYVLVITGVSAFVLLQIGNARFIISGQWYLLILVYVVCIGIIIIVKSPTWGFVYWLLLSPFARVLVTPFTNFKIEFNLVVLTILLGVLIFKFLADKKKLRAPNSAEWYLIGYFIYAMIIRNTENIPERWFYSQLLLTPLVIYYLAKATINTERHISWLLTGMMFVGIIWAVFGIYEHHTKQVWYSVLAGRSIGLYGAGSDVEGGRATGPAGHYYLYGNGIMLATLIVIYKAFWEKRAVIKFALYSMLPVLALGLFYGFTRGPYISYVVAIFVMAFLAKETKKAYVTVSLILSVSIIFLTPIILSSPKIQARMESRTDQSRMVTFKTNIDMFLDNFVVGVGMYKNQENIPKYASYKHLASRDQSGLVTYRARPHNETLLVATELGVIGLVLFYGCIFSFIRHLLIIKRKMKRNKYIGSDVLALAVAFNIGVLVSMITDEFQQWPYMYFLMFT
ncbi:MAG: O-antigen ligase family protein, partial [Armatimonadota bacterium]